MSSTVTATRESGSRQKLAPNTPAFQKVLDENAQLIQTISDFQHAGRPQEASQLQQVLYRNLLQLANTTDSNLLDELQAPLTEPPTNGHSQPLSSNQQQRENARYASNEQPVANITVPQQGAEPIQPATIAGNDKENRQGPALGAPQSVDNIRAPQAPAPNTFYPGSENQQATGNAPPVASQYDQQPQQQPGPMAALQSYGSVQQQQPPQQSPAMQQQLQQAPNPAYPQHVQQQYYGAVYQQYAPSHQAPVGYGMSRPGMPPPHNQPTDPGGYYGMQQQQQRYQYAGPAQTQQAYASPPQAYGGSPYQAQGQMRPPQAYWQPNAYGYGPQGMEQQQNPQQQQAPQMYAGNPGMQGGYHQNYPNQQQQPQQAVNQQHLQYQQQQQQMQQPPNSSA